MVMTGDTPAFGDGQIFIGDVIAVSIANAREFAALYSVESAIFIDQTQRFMQGRCEAFVSYVFGRLFIHAIHDPDFPLADSDGDAMIIEHGDTADFQHQITRCRFPVGGPRFGLRFGGHD